MKIYALLVISRVRQIYFSPIHLGSLDSGWFPYHNTDKVTPYFENDVIKKLYLQLNSNDSKDLGSLVSLLLKHDFILL